MRTSDLIVGLGAILAGIQTIQGKKTLKEQAPTGPVGGHLDTDAEPKVETHKVNSLSDRIKYIQSFIRKGREHPKVRALATQILSKKCGDAWCVAEKSWTAEVKAIFAAVRDQIRYTRDFAHKDLYQHPLRAWAARSADCDDFTIVLASLLQSVGYPVHLRVVRTKDAPDWNHIYLTVGVPPTAPRQWLPLDASVDQPAGWEAPASMIAARRDFPVT